MVSLVSGYRLSIAGNPITLSKAIVDSYPMRYLSAAGLRIYFT